jgi:hypothetical protein
MRKSLLELYITDALVTRVDTESAGFRSVNINGIYFGIYCSPTFNCQNYSIAGFNEILSAPYSDDEIRELIRHISLNITKRKILLLDVDHFYRDKILNIFRDCKFFVDQNYESTNDSEMTLFYINVTNII